MIILIILIIVLLLSFLFINKTLKKKEKILDEVKLQEDTIKNDGFAIMYQQEDGTYYEGIMNYWPTDMVFNAELSGCIDIDGKRIENSLSFDSVNYKINVTVGETAYCYVYFDIETAYDKLIKNASNDELWDSPLEDDGYRYVGTNPNNYICFGTAYQDTCTSDTDKYMYRIIGIFKDGDGNQHLKLIKKDALLDWDAWHSDGYNDTDWNNSDLYINLNDSAFLTNTSYLYLQYDAWLNKISTWNYTMTNTKTYENYNSNSAYGLDYGYNTGKTIYLHELNKSSKTNEICYFNSNTVVDCNIGEWKILSAKIGLMYVSDYVLSLGNESLDYIDSDKMKTSWLNDTYQTWTMTRMGNGGVASLSKYFSWYIADGTVDVIEVYAGSHIYPVFYLRSDIKLSKYIGNGSITDPYIIEE